MRWSLAPLLALGCACVALPVQAQSLYGPGGLFLHAAAVVPPEGQLTPAVLVLPQRNPQTGEPPVPRTTTWISGSLDYGATPRLELGVTAVKVTNWPGDETPSFGGYGKYLLLKEQNGRPAVAVGGTYLGLGSVNTRLAFLALRDTVYTSARGPIAADVGLQYADEVDGVPRSDFQPYLGVEAAVARALTFVAEGRPRLRNEHGVPLAVSLVSQSDSGYHLALTWANNGLSSSPRFGFGVGFLLPSR